MNAPQRASHSRLNVNLDRVLHRALKQRALDDDTTEAAIVRRLIAVHLGDPSCPERSQEQSAAQDPWLDSQGPGCIRDSRHGEPEDGAPTFGGSSVDAARTQPARVGLPTAPPPRR